MLILLIIIYMAFISLGLPDSILGSAWPAMSADLGLPLSFAGLVAMVASMGTVISSLFATRMVMLFGAGKTVAFSVFVTAFSLFGFSVSGDAWMLLLLAVPLGLGGGAVDAVLNNFVALNYKSKHMNYLHSFWGVGATAGPIIIAVFLAQQGGWRGGYETISYIQLAMAFILLATLVLWRKSKAVNDAVVDKQVEMVSNAQALKIPGVKSQLVMFFSYTSLEMAAGLWAASFLVTQYGTTPVTAAFWTAMYFLGITVGRFACGLMADYIDERKLIRIGVIVIFVGVILLLMPLSVLAAKLGFVFIGLGCAPVFPNTLHLTPMRFGKNASQAVIGLSMACAYVGISFLPPLFGYLASLSSFVILPFILFSLAVLVLLTTENLNRIREAKS